MSTGERLRQARLDAGKTLGQVSAETKIQLWILEAIEHDDFSRVPGGDFVRGYLTAVARAVGINPSEVLPAHSAEAPPPPEVPPVAQPSLDPNEPTTPLWQYVAIVAMVLAAAVLWRNMTSSSSEVATAPAPPPSATAPRSPAPSPAPSAGLPTASGATATTGATRSLNAPLVVQLHATAEVWIEADADGDRKVYQLLEQGQELVLEGHKEIRLLVGDAAAVTYTINGKPGRPLGGTGVVRQFVVSPRNIESLTGRPQRTDG